MPGIDFRDIRITQTAAGQTFTVNYFSAMLVQPEAFVTSLKGVSSCLYRRTTKQQIKTITVD